MEAAGNPVAYYAAIFAGILVSVVLAFLPLMIGERWKAAKDRARARRLADARMNARLLRLNL